MEFEVALVRALKQQAQITLFLATALEAGLAGEHDKRGHAEQGEETTGTPVTDSFLVDVTDCDHPEGKRLSTVAFGSAEGGWMCTQCGRFNEPEKEDKA